MASTADVVTTRQPKETKAQKVERLKRSKNPWEHFDEIREFARQGRAAVLPEWANLYFKWWGIYTQGNGAGAIGGTGGEGKATEYFMMRIALPNGLLRSSQLRAIAQISERYGHSLADLTVRQNIQLHWLTIESIPEVIEALGAVGLQPEERLRRRHAQHHRVPARRYRFGRTHRRIIARRRSRAPALRQQRFLQSPAQIQNLDHRLPCLVLLP